jgi:hypothetical protein
MVVERLSVKIILCLKIYQSTFLLKIVYPCSTSAAGNAVTESKGVGWALRFNGEMLIFLDHVFKVQGVLRIQRVITHTENIELKSELARNPICLSFGY